MQYTDIRFPHLGIVLSHVGRYISIGNFQIMFYGIIIDCGFLAGWWLHSRRQSEPAESRDLYGLSAVDDDSGDYWCKNLLRCIFMGCI